MYETIPAVTSSTTEESTSLEVQTSHCSPTTNMEDSVFMSERGSTASSSNLSVHPRTQVIKDGFCQAPKSHPTGQDPNNYDTPRFSTSGSDIRLSSSSTSMQHLPVRRQW